MSNINSTIANNLNQQYQQQLQSGKQGQKSQRIILEFNKNGLQYLTSQKTFSQAFEYFKKAQKAIVQELKLEQNNKKINQLAAVTYNNLACYYKKTNKPKVALSYLKKALQIQVFKVQNWIATASTHLNICAIYSFIKKHQEACDHAMLALKMLGKWNDQKQENARRDKQYQNELKAYSNIRMLSNYNAAIENQYLKKFEQAQKFYQTTKQVALSHQQKNVLLIKSCQQGIDRMKQQQKVNKKKLIEIITKRKQHDEKNNHQFMRKNKKNYHKEGDDWRELVHNRKYAEYKIQTQHTSSAQTQTRKHQSVGKLASIKPVLHTDQPGKKSLHSNNALNSSKKINY